MRAFIPECDGILEVEDAPEDFVERMAARVHGGLLLPGDRRRAAYSVRSLGRHVIHFGADDFLTSINIGLNEVTLQRMDERTIAYRFTYWSWLLYCVLLCGGLCACLLAGYVVFAFLNPGLVKTSGGALVFYGMIAFWGVLWPWILAAGHRRPAARALERIIREVCSGETEQAVAAGGARAYTGGIRYRSSATLFGLPFIVVAMGPGPDGLRGKARGFIAIGDTAVGVIAMGGVAVGGVTTGGVSLGVVSMGGAAIGGIAMGGLAVGGLALGGMAIGGYAIGGLAIGLWTQGGLALPWRSLLRQ
ncbi:MAG TPA: hypothetical protein PKI11_14500 [Candidatus Hydrogenedentes bacterium]|nr:hypothetical protein [Candidatus Hydrogenedentota bacterium]